MTIAFISSAERGRADRLLAEVARGLVAEGVRVAGAVQHDLHCDAGPCDMEIEVLPQGGTVRISQRLGPGSRGCRLDAGALEEAVARVGAALRGPVDLLVLNKFGKREAEGAGFRAVLAEAVGQGVPVLTAVGALNRPAFEAFAEGLARPLPPDPAAILDWARGAVAQSLPSSR